MLKTRLTVVGLYIIIYRFARKLTFMKQKLKLILCIISLLGYINISAQTESIAPVTQAAPIIWLNPDGTTGECGGNGTSVCSTTICLGESICFSYWVNQTNNNYSDYNTNHTTLSFSDGGSIIVENTAYSGPNPTGCVNYAPTTVGIVTTYGVNNSVFSITVLPSTPPVLSADISPQNNICEGSQVCAQSLTTPNANYSFSSTTDLGCFNGVFCSTPNTSAFCFPVGTHQILYTVNAGHTCENSIIYNVTVVPTNLNLTVTPPDACSNNYCFNIAPSSSCNFGNITYTWNIVSTNGASTIYYQTNSLQNICVNIPPDTYNVFVYTSDGVSFASTTITVPPIDECICQNCTNTIGTSGTISSSPAINQRYCINNNVTVNGNVTFSNAEFKIGANVKITVASGAVLTIDRGHFYGGTNMWSGIVVQNGGKLNIINNSLIEDAIAAVSIINNTMQSNILTVDASIFNRNANSIEIKGYNQNITNYPFSITNSLFTCRKISDCSTIGGWPLTATVKGMNPTSSPLESPYINNANFPVVNLKAPYATNKSFRGILITNVGTSNVTTTSSSYNEITIGTLSGTNSYNVFDNLWYGIDATNSNVSVVNSIFQNGYNLAFPSLFSAGIRSIANSNVNRRLQASTSSYNYNNKFYDLSRAVFTQFLHDLNINYCEMYSKRVFNPTAASKYGAYGISSMSNHYQTINLNNNKIFNIDNAIVFNAGISTYAVGAASGSGQFLGSIYVNNNLIRSHVNGYTPDPSLHYGAKAITITGLISSNTVTQPNAEIISANNSIFDYANGISCSNWNPMGVGSRFNEVTIRNNATNVYQYGIEHANNTLYSSYSFKQYGIVANNVTANTISTSSNNYGIRSVQNANYAIVCNTVSNTYNGHAFSGTHINDAFVRFNIMSQNRYGFVLENVGIIGQQGEGYSDGSATTAENQWLGTWTAPNFKTATINSNAQLSKMYVRHASTYNPSGSGFTTNLFDYGTKDYYYNGTTGTILKSIFADGTVYNCFLTKPAPSNPNTEALEFIASSGATSGIEHAIARFVAKSQLFVYLENNPDARTPGILTGFYSSNKKKYRDIFFDVETKVAQGDINSAKNEVAAFDPQNTPETKHKQFYDLLFKYQNQTLNTGDEQSLKTLAKGCPYIDGTVVHQARALYNVAYDQNANFPDSCEYTANNARLGKTADEVYDEEATLQGNDVFLYPNPSNGNDIFISLVKTDVENIDVTINNVNGLAVSNETIVLTNGIGKFNVKAPSGVYMVIITNKQTNERVIKKLVIQK